MSAHAVLSASSAARWIACPPSVKLSENIEEKPSAYAAEGSLAHSIAELKLRRALIEPMTTRAYNAAMKKLKNQEGYSDEMQGYTDAYVDYIAEIVHAYDTPPYIAAERRVDYSKYAPKGFGTADCVIIHGNEMHVVDFKYGKGVPVAAENNPQLMLYALGTLSGYGLLYPIKQVSLHVVQPRIGNNNHWGLSVDDLIAFGENTVKPAAELAVRGEGEYCPGDHCRFCRANAICRARAEDSLKLFAHTGKAPDTISEDEIGRMLEQGKHVAAWLSDLQDYALAAILAGDEIPGWKVVEGRSNRTFKNVDSAISKLTQDGYKKTMFYERRPVTLTAMEKIVGKAEFDRLLADEIVKPLGKPTLVPAADKREPFKLTTAKQDFTAGEPAKEA